MSTRPASCCGTLLSRCCAPARAAVLFSPARQGAVASHFGSATAGAAGADPAALPLQQHQRSAVAGAERAAARGDERSRIWPICFACSMRDNRQLAPLADEVRLCRQYLESEKLRLGNRLSDRVARREHAATTRWSRRWSCSRCSRTRSITASSRPARRESSRSTSSCAAAKFTPSCATRISFAGEPPRGNKMAMDNIRERLALHFDAEASLESKRQPRQLRGAHPHAVPGARRGAEETCVSEAPLRLLIVDDEAPARAASARVAR